MDKKRIAWVDNLKAVGIFWVILAHHNINPKMTQYIYSFHMPLFFLLSGYLLDIDRYTNINTFIQKKLRTLILPYFVFAFTSYLFWLLVVRNLSIRGTALSTPVLKSFLGIFYSVGTEGWNIPLGTPLWFLTCLFVVEILFWYVYKISANISVLKTMILIFSITGYLGSVFMPFRLPWNIDVALTAVTFYGTGFIFKNTIDAISQFAVKRNLFLIIPFFILNILFCFLNGKIDMYENHYGSPIFFYLSALSGTMVFIILSKIIPPNKLLSFIGSNTIIILGLTGVSLFIIRGIFYSVYKNLPDLNNISIITGMLFSFLQLALLSPVIYVIGTYFPFLLGRAKQ